MTERLTDEELADIFGDNNLRVGDAYATAHEVAAMAGELRALRAAALTEPHVVKVARAAAALPIDDDADARMTRALNLATKGHRARKLTIPALTAEERDALEHARELVEQEDVCCGENDCQASQCLRNRRAIAVIARLLGGDRG